MIGLPRILDRLGEHISATKEIALDLLQDPGIPADRAGKLAELYANQIQAMSLLTEAVHELSGVQHYQITPEATDANSH